MGGQRGPHTARSAPTIYDVARGRRGRRRRRCRARSPGPAGSTRRPPSASARRPTELGYRTNPMARALPTGADRDDRAGHLRRHQPVLLRDHPRRRDGGRRGRLHDAARRHPGVGSAGAGGDWSGRCRRSRASCSATLADVGLGHPDDGQADARWSCSTGAVAEVPSVVTDNAARHPPRGRAPGRAGPRARSPTSPVRRHRGPTACAGGRCARRRSSWTCASAGSGPYRADRRGRAGRGRGPAQAPATAVVAYNDLMAIGLMRGLDRAGVRVPHDVSVVGFDNIFARRIRAARP